MNKEDIEAVAGWLVNRGKDEHEIAFRPARVLMQDFTGVPAVVDLAAMRDAMVALGGDPDKINPLVPVDLVIDHSVVVDYFGTSKRSSQNVKREYEQNQERYRFLKWGQQAFSNFSVVPPGTGICHQVNLEYLAQTVWTREGEARRQDGRGRLSRHAGRHRQPHHDGQRPGRARLGRRRHRGRGRHARPAAVDAAARSGRLQADGRAARGRHRDRPRADGHADAAQEGRRRQVRRILRPRPQRDVGRRPRDHRQHGAGIWRDLRLLPDRRRRRSPISRPPRARPRASRWSRPTPRRKACSAPRATPDPVFTDTLELELGEVAPSLAGPKRPQDRVLLADAKDGFARRDDDGVQAGRRDRSALQGRGQELRSRPWRRRDRRDHLLHQHLQPQRDGRRRPARAQRGRQGPDGRSRG